MRFITNENREMREQMIKDHLMTLNKDNESILVKVVDTNVYVFVEKNCKEGKFYIETERTHSIYTEPGNYCVEDVVIEYNLNDFYYKFHIIGEKPISFYDME